MPVITSNNEISNETGNYSLEHHPCFNEKARHAYARIHLPVAPRCNVQCRFCDRKYSCVNESRPGVTAMVMTPTQALEHLKNSLRRVPNISVVGIAGPGDPFANPRETIETLRLVRKNFPHMMLCVSTNGLNILPYVDELKSLKVSHVTITVNAVDPSIGEQIYEWMYYKNNLLRGPRAAFVLWDNQQLSIQALNFRGILVKVNTVCIPGINASHIEVISKTVAKLGASLHNVIPLIPTPNTAFASIEEPKSDEIKKIRLAAQRYLPQMEHCSRCRSDAIGLLGEKGVVTYERPLEFSAQLEKLSNTEDEALPDNKHRPNVAIASREGLFVNMHLGESESLRIYDVGGCKPILVDIRKTPAPTPECANSHWTSLSEILKDCFLLLVSGIGPVPRSILTAHGVKVKIIEDYIQDALSQIKLSNDENHEKPFQCGESCSGNKSKCGMER